MIKAALTVFSLLLISPLAMADEINQANTAWILTATALVLFMTIPGLSLFYAGLVRVKNGRAAEMLLPFCVPKGKYSEKAEDSLVQIGEPAIMPSVVALSNRKLAKQAHYVLKCITGETFGQSQDKWTAWYVRWKEGGGGNLPQYARGTEPWLGGSGE